VKHFEFSLSDTGLLPLCPAASCKAKEIEIVMAPLDVQPEAVDVAATLLSDVERKKAARFSFDCDRRRFVIARSHLRCLLGERLNMRPEDVELVYGKRGKPALARRFSGANLQFNVAHADDVAVFALSSGLDIGVDIERVRIMRDAEDIAAQFFSPGEYASYSSLAQDDKPLGFLTCWTRKEAFVKALGDGLYHPLPSFDSSPISSPTPCESGGVLRFKNSNGENCDWVLHTFSPAPGLVASVAVGKRADGPVATKSPLRGAPDTAVFS
jgi:4'-phosphopantetheinyl transferase